MPMSGRRWRACALATVRRSNCTCGFPAYSFHEGTNYEIRSRPCRVGPAPHLSGRSGPAVSSDDDVRVFPKGTDPPHRPYSSDFPALPSGLRLPPSPNHSRRRSLGHTAFTVLVVLFGSPTTDRASLPISLSLIGSLTPMLLGTLPVLLRSRAVLPYRAIRKHLGAVGE